MLQKVIDILKITLLIVLFVIFVIFIFNNFEFVKINLFPFAYIVEIRLFLLIIFTFILGMFFSMFLNFLKGVLNINIIKKNNKNDIKENKS
jgi:uncharacterized integral membrane protein